MPRHGGRAVIEHGLKIDLSRLRRDGQFASGQARTSRLTWQSSRTGEVTATIGYSFDTIGRNGWVRLQYQAGDRPINEVIYLERFPQPFGGIRWYFLCPSTGERAQCLYLPAGATHFRSRAAYGLRYLSQSLSPSSRYNERAHALARRMVSKGPPQWREEFEDWDFPPKPPWMRWATYAREYERWERYDAAVFSGEMERR